jgi:hypothetical protein
VTLSLCKGEEGGKQRGDWKTFLKASLPNGHDPQWIENPPRKNILSLNVGYGFLHFEGLPSTLGVHIPPSSTLGASFYLGGFLPSLS